MAQTALWDNLKAINDDGLTGQFEAIPPDKSHLPHPTALVLPPD